MVITQRPDGATGPSHPRLSRGRRHAVVAAAVVAAAAAQAVGASPASATTYDPLYSSQETIYSTWFFGRTSICVRNTTPNQWWVVMSAIPNFIWSDYVEAHTSRCVTRSFAGLGVDVYARDLNGAAPVGDHLDVYRPIGP